MKRSWIYPILLAAVVGCGDEVVPDRGLDDSTVSIAGGGATGTGVMNGTVFGATYAPGVDTVTAPLADVTVEIYQVVPASAAQRSLDLLDSVVVDTVAVDTLPVDPTLILRGTAVTGAAGTFSFTEIPAGEYMIFLKPAEGMPYAPSLGWSLVSDGSSTTAGTFHLWRIEILMAR